jgi:hypothetical protein
MGNCIPPPPCKFPENAASHSHCTLLCNAPNSHLSEVPMNAPHHRRGQDIKELYRESGNFFSYEANSLNSKPECVQSCEANTEYVLFHAGGEAAAATVLSFRASRGKRKSSIYMIHDEHSHDEIQPIPEGHCCRDYSEETNCVCTLKVLMLREMIVISN